ncbi:unnamed protein product, partial [Amoebophrya sp. A120]
IVTALGTGTASFATAGQVLEQLPEDVRCIGSTSSSPSSSKFVHYADLQELSTFCLNYHLPHDPPIIIEGKRLVQEFLQKLTAGRDYMTENNLIKILSGLRLETRSFHQEVLGDVLEGLVLHCFTKVEGG